MGKVLWPGSKEGQVMRANAIQLRCTRATHPTMSFRKSAHDAQTVAPVAERGARGERGRACCAAGCA